MIIKSIRLKNIRSYTDAAVDFPEGGTLLAGDVGSGKSTILLAIDFALFGLRRGEIEGNDLLRHGKGEGEVRLIFSVNGREIAITRTLKRSRNGIMQDAGIIESEGTTYDYTPTELKARVLEMLGYPQDSIKKNRPIFRYTVYTPQEDMKRIMFDSGARIETLRKIFGIDRYGIVRGNSKIFGSELRSISREAKAYAEGIAEKEAGLAEMEGKISDAKRNIDKLSAEVRELDGILNQKQKEFGALKEDAKTLNELHRKESELGAKISALESGLRRAENDIASYASELRKRDDKLDAPKELSILEERLLSKTQLHDSLTREIALLREFVENLSSLIRKGECYVCGRSVSVEDFERKLEEQKKRLVSAENEAVRATNEVRKIRSDKDDLIRAIQIAENCKKFEVLLRSRQQQKEEMLSEKARLEEEISEIHSRIVAAGDVERNISDYESEISMVNQSRINIERKIASIAAQKEILSESVDVARRELEKKREYASRAKKYDTIDSWLPRFSELVETMERHVMLSLQKEFNYLFSQWFSVLMGDSLYVRIDESFSPVIEQNGFETRYDNLSGGEKTAVALAYRLALNSVINTMIDSINTKNLLILDEPTDGFSSDQLDRLRDVIKSVSGQIIIVSHEPKIDTYVDNVIRVYKENHVSKINQ